MANTPIKGFAGETANGLRTVAYFHDGPSSYSTGGETITAQSLGLRKILSVQSSGSDDGAYWTTVRFAVKIPGGASSFKLLWSVIATGVEAGAIDLSSRFVVLVAVGQ